VTQKRQLGEVIREAREAAGMTQLKLAYLAGTSQDSIWAIEQGKRNPGWSTLARIMRALNLTGKDLDGAIEFEAGRLPKRGGA
jgi:transcriptional regulator with XRE-family HTH domain